MPTLLEAFGPTVAHLDHHPAVTTFKSLAAEPLQTRSAELQKLFLDPTITRIYHFDLGLSALYRALNVATCRARQVVGKLFEQRQSQTTTATVCILFGPVRSSLERAANSESRPHQVSFEEGVAFLADHLCLQEHPVWDQNRQAVYFAPLDLWVIQASVASQDSPATNGTKASLVYQTAGRIHDSLLNTPTLSQKGGHSIEFIWHNHASMSLPAAFLHISEESNMSCQAFLSSDDILQDMDAKSFASRLAPVSSDWRKVHQYCKKHQIPFISAQCSMARLGGRELDDVPNFPLSLDLELRNATLIKYHRTIMQDNMSKSLLQAAQVMGACRHVYGKSLASEVQDLCSEAQSDWDTLPWTHAAAGIQLRNRSLYPVSSCTFKAAKRDVHSIANTCGSPLNGPLGAFSSAVLDEFAAAPIDSDLLFLPVCVNFDWQRMVVGVPDSTHWILARTALTHLGGYFAEIMRWQGCRPSVITRSDVSTPAEHLVDLEVATNWRVFAAILSKMLVKTLSAILSLEDIEEQARWLEVVRELEHAASRLAYGPMTERAEEVLRDKLKETTQGGHIKSSRTNTLRRRSSARRQENMPN